MSGVTDEMVERGARELVRHQSNGCCDLGRICGLCDCFAASDTPPGHHRDGYARQEARAVLEAALNGDDR